jgi:hypothetical protein
MSSGLTTTNGRKRKRDNCSLCISKGINGNGHLAEYCAYEGGPFFNNLKGARAKRKLAEQKSKTSTSPATGGVPSSEDLQAKFAADMDIKITQLYAKIDSDDDAHSETINSYNQAQWTAIRESAMIMGKMQDQLTKLQATVDQLSRQPKDKGKSNGKGKGNGSGKGNGWW